MPPVTKKSASWQFWDLVIKLVSDPLSHYSDVINHQPLDCLLNSLFRRRSKKTPKSASLAFVRGIHRSPMNSPFVRGIHRSPANSPHKRPVTRKCFHLMTSSCCVIAVAKRYKLFTKSLLEDWDDQGRCGDVSTGKCEIRINHFCAELL